MDDGMDSVLRRFPDTVDKAADLLMADLSYSDKSRLANMPEKGIVQFHARIGALIRARFRIPGNDPLVKDCANVSGLSGVSPEQASFIIFKTMIQKVKQGNVMTLIK